MLPFKELRIAQLHHSLLRACYQRSSSHHWYMYFSLHIVSLAMFYEHVSENTKVAMVKNCTHLIIYPRGMQLDTSGQDRKFLDQRFGGILHKKLFITVLSSWHSVKVSCSLAIGWYTFQSTKTKLNVKLLRGVDDYHNAEYGMALT